MIFVLRMKNEGFAGGVTLRYTPTAIHLSRSGEIELHKIILSMEVVNGYGSRNRYVLCSSSASPR